jgi:hypothetical protein
LFVGIFEALEGVFGLLFVVDVEFGEAGFGAGEGVENSGIG